MSPIDGLMATDRSDADTNDDGAPEPAVASGPDADPAPASPPLSGVLADDMAGHGSQ